MTNAQIAWEHLRLALTQPCPNCSIKAIVTRDTHLTRYGGTVAYLATSPDVAGVQWGVIKQPM